MKVVTQCEHCEKAYRLPDKYCGKTIRCKGCGEAFEVPSLEDSLEESGMEEDFDPDDEDSPEPEPKKRRKASAKDSATRRKKGPRDSATRRRKRKSSDDDDGDDDDDDDGDGDESGEKGQRRKDRSASAERKRKKSDSATKRRKTGSRKSVDKDDKKDDKKGDDKKARDKRSKSDGSAEKKRGPKDSALRRKKGSKDSAVRKRKKDDSAEAPGKKRTGALKGKKSRSGGSGIRKTSAIKRRGRSGGDGDEGDSGDKTKLMIGGGIGAVVIIIVVALMLRGPGGPDPATKKWYKEATQHLETAEGYRRIGSMSQASETYASVLAEIDKQSTKYPADNPQFPKFKELVESARSHAPQAKELADLMVKINGGEGQEEVLAKVNDPDAAVRLAAIAMLRAKAEEEPDFRKALSMLTRDTDPKVADQAKQVLIQAGGRFAVPFLIEMLESPNPTAQTRALEKIVAIDHEDALPAIHKCLTILDPSKNPQDKGLALQLVNRLGEFASKSSVEPLEAFKSKTSGDLKGAVEAVIETCKGG